MIDMLKILLGISDNSKDAILSTIVRLAEEEVKQYCNLENCENMSSLIIDIAVYKYNRLGTEGLTSENFSGVSYSYAADYPDSIKRRLNACRKLKVI